MTTTDLILTDWFKTHYEDIDWDGSVQVQVALYSRVPQFTEYTAGIFADFVNASEIDDLPEWVGSQSLRTAKTSIAGSPESFFLTKVILDGSLEGLQLVDSSGFPIAVEDGAGWYIDSDPAQEIIAAAVFYLIGPHEGVTNPLLFASTKGFGTNTVAHYESVYGQFETGAAIGEQYIIGYDTVTSMFSSGYTLLKLPIPIWEGAHAQHLWIQPQRINFAANPSFERSVAPVPYWRVGRESGSGSATLSRAGSTGTPAGVGGTDRPYCGKVLSSGGSERTVLESNLFPKVNDWYSVSFFASGDAVVGDDSGSLYFGIVARPYDSSGAIYIRNKDAAVLEGGTAYSGFKKFTALIQIPDDVTDLMFRVEYSGTTLWVDNVLIDPHEGQYEYFDGNSTISSSGDFRWMGGSTYANTHFSLWYNNYENTRARLLGDYDTLDDLYKPGLIEEWTPTGSNITAHWDAVVNVTPLNWVGDAFYPINDVNGTPVSTITSSFDFSLGTI